MNCLKCGRETPAEQVFCEECLQDMEKYPIKPGTVVFLPRHRETPVVRKAPKRRSVSLDDQLKQQKKRTRVLAAALLISLGLILLMLYPSVQYLKNNRFKIGQNYTAVITTTSPEDGENVE